MSPMLTFLSDRRLNFKKHLSRDVIVSILFLVAGLLSPPGIFAATSVGGRVSTDTTWTLSGSPYVVTSSVQFYGMTSTPITLTIEPGVVVKFQTGTYLQIANGTSYPASLNAVGTVEAPIVFTSYKDDTAGGDTNGDGSATTPAPGNWNYLYLWRGSNSSVLDHTDVRYGGGGGQGNIYIYESSPTIQNSVIKQSSNIGISIFTQTVSSAPNILNNVIDQYATYGIKTVSTYTATTPVAGLIQGNTISNSGQYGMYFDGVISAMIQSNQIAKGIYFTSSNGSPVLTGNVISDLGSVTAQIPADILNAFLSQNTLQGIGPTTSLNVIGDTITGTTTLTLQFYSYVVTSGMINVNGTTGNPATLVVQAGVRMSFASGIGIQVGTSTSTPGILQVQGTSGSPVLFTKSGSSAWSGIMLFSGTVGAQTNLQYATIEYAGSGTSPTTGQFYIYSNNATLDHVTVQNGTASGIIVTGGLPVMTSVTVSQMGADGISVNGASGTTAPSISQVYISNAGRYGVYVNPFLGIVGGSIQNSTISSPGQYGIYCATGGGYANNISIQNNQIAKGIYFASSVGSPVLTGNVIQDLGSVAVQVPADILNMFLTQNTLQGIGPTTSLNVVGDTMTGTTTLTTQWYSYIVVSGNLSVNGTTGNPATLVVQAGVRISFASGSGITVGSSTSTPGILQVQGTSGSPVLFTKSGSSAWSGISLYSGTVGAQTSLQYATIEYAGSGTSPTTGQLYSYSNNATLDHVTVQNGTASGIIVTGGSPVLTNVTVSQMGADGISINGASGTTAPSISQVSISNAGRYGVYVNPFLGIVGGSIQNSTIISPGQYGIYCATGGGYANNISIQNNQIAKGVYFASSVGSPVLTGNLISDLGSVAAQVPADILNAFLSQNTLQGIGPTTSLNVVADTIAGTTTLTPQFYSYVVSGNQINVNGTTGNPATLVIQAGVRMSFASTSGVTVGSSTSTPGILQVQGTSGSPVLFTKSGSSAWSGITLFSGTVGAQTNLQYATIEYAGSGTSPTTGQLYINYISPTLDHVTVQNGTASGIIVTGGSPAMTNMTVSQVGADGISINGASGYTTAPSISQATVSNAGRYGVYVNGSNGAIGGTIQGSTIQTPVNYGLYINQGAPAFLNNSIDGSLYMTNQSGLPSFTGNTIRNFNTKTGRIAVGVLQQLQSQNTLLDIDPTTVLELNGTTVATDTTLGTYWKIYNVVAGNITVSGTPPATLTINPGVTVRFAASLYLGIGGSNKGILRALGTAAAPILLTTLNPAPNNWRGIVFSNTAVAWASLLEYVTIDQGGKQDAAVYGSSTAFTLSHCTISNSSLHGIQLYSADLTLQFSRVYNNSQRGLYVPNASSRVTIRNSDFYSNSGGAILNEQTTLSVDARDTWWGDASGPGGSGPGSGNSVSAKVLYDPWLGTSYTYPFAITDAYPSTSSFTQGGGTADLTAGLTQNADWTLQIKDSTSTVMKNASGSGRAIHVSWDGTNTSGVPQPDGTYTFRMDATAGGTAAPVIGRMVLNSNLPLAQITEPAPDQLILTPTVNISGTASATAFTSYSVDVGLGTSPFQFMTLTNASPGPVVNGPLATWTLQSTPPSGTYQVRLKVTGNGGVTAETTRYVRIDHTPPLPPGITQPATPTAAQPISVTGTAEPDATVELYVNDQWFGQATASGGDGSFSFTDVSLVLGSNSLKARAKDGANNVSSYSDKKTVVYLPAGESLIEILSPADGSTVYK